jgi:hypothetical protein
MTTEQKSANPPSREDIIKWYKDEIELATLRADLAKLQRDAAVSEAERINAIGAIAQMTQSKGEDASGTEAPSNMRTLKKDPVTQ